MNDTLNIPANGGAVGYGYNAGASGHSSFTWTNLTEDFDEQVEGFADHTGASDVFASEQVARSVTCSPGETVADNGMVLASWGQA